MDFKAHDLRDWTHDRHRTTDDEPYGGGDGLVMKCAPIFEAYESLCGAPCGGPDAVDRASGEGSADAAGQMPGDSSDAAQTPGEGSDSAAVEQALSAASTAADQAASKPYTIFLAPQGRRFDDACACELAKQDRLLFICGHYEGIDQRFIDECVDEELSMGDFVVTGGEIPAMAVTDAICRMVPGVLPEEECFTEESHWAGLLEYPQYSRPDEWHGRRVPDVLLSGHHENVAKWRKKESYKRTMLRRPDLWAQFDEKQLKTKSEKKVLAEAKAEAEAIRAAEVKKAEETSTEE